MTNTVSSLGKERDICPIVDLENNTRAMKLEPCKSVIHRDVGGGGHSSFSVTLGNSYT